jgi:hypothetical protein
MKFAKLSIAAVAVLGMSTGAFAGDKSEVTFNPFGSAKLYYETISTDADNSDLFAQKPGTPNATNPKNGPLSLGGASGQALLSLGATGKINSCFGYGVEGMAVDTLGLENNVVSGVRMGHGRNDGPLDTQFWFPQAYLTYHPCDMGTNTTFKIGRQYLDTPLAFTEKWNVAPNSFDAIVALNQDIINTTLVGAYVGRGNGEFVQVTNGDNFDTYGTDGAYAIGAITSLLDGALPISLWGYDVVNVAQAFWGDAGYKLDLGNGIKLDLGAQYGMMTPDDDANSLATALGATNPDDTSGFGVKVGGNMNLADMNFGLTVAYSSMDDDGVLALANTATVKNAESSNGISPTLGGKKTKLYTAAIYGDGTHVAIPGSDAFKVKATTKLAGIGGLAVQYVHNENDQKPVLDMDEIDVILSSGILPGGLNTKLIYMNRSYDNVNSDAVHNDADHVRIILSKKF